MLNIFHEFKVLKKVITAETINVDIYYKNNFDFLFLKLFHIYIHIYIYIYH